MRYRTGAAAVRAHFADSLMDHSRQRELLDGETLKPCSTENVAQYQLQGNLPCVLRCSKVRHLFDRHEDDRSKPFRGGFHAERLSFMRAFLGIALILKVYDRYACGLDNRLW